MISGPLPLTAKELAAEIDVYLRKFEADPVLNAEYVTQGGSRLKSYWGAHAWPMGRFVRVVYVSYQGSSALTIPNATRYLHKLRNGFVGRHFEALREKKESQS